jgi:DNA-directed RNA polymerase subunit RPC12/RpoP
VKQPPVKTSPVDLSIQCPECGTKMQPEHAHYRCLACGYRDSCCM